MDPKMMHKEAISMAKGGDLKGSLKYFRAAVRSNPENHKWMNDLGVTEMRVGELNKAATRFLSSLLLSPNYSKALSNIKDLQGFMTDEQWTYVYAEWLEADPSHSPLSGVTLVPTQTGQRHKTKPLPVVEFETLLDPNNETAQTFILGEHPYILHGAMEHWDLDKFGEGNLVEHFGNSRVDYYPQGMKEESVHPFFSSLSSALKNFHDPDGIYDTVDASYRNTYIQWNVNFEDWEKLDKEIGMDLPPMFKTDDDWLQKCFSPYDRVNDFLVKTHWRMVLIGQTGAGMFNHKDTLQSTSFQAQISGRKRWHLCPPSQDSKLYKAGDVNTFNPDYPKYPRALELDCFDDVVETGMMVYYPANYWHQTRNMDPFTLSVSGTLVTEGNAHLISKEFDRECDASKVVRIFNPEEKLCEGLRECKEHWAMKSWGGDMAEDVEKLIGRRKEL